MYLESSSNFASLQSVSFILQLCKARLVFDISRYSSLTSTQKKEPNLSRMSGDECIERPLFGGALSSAFSLRFQDLSNIRQVPDHQEAFADPARDESLIFELLDLKPDLEDSSSATWFLQDLATEQDAEGSVVMEQSGIFEANGICYRNMPAIITTAVGQMAISKGRQGREAQNIVKVYLANLRLKEVGTDVLIIAYEPILINPFSESARDVGAGLAVPAVHSGCMPMADVFKLAVSNFKGKNFDELKEVVDKVYQKVESRDLFLAQAESTMRAFTKQL